MLFLQEHILTFGKCQSSYFQSDDSAVCGASSQLKARRLCQICNLDASVDDAGSLEFHFLPSYPWICWICCACAISYWAWPHLVSCLSSPPVPSLEVGYCPIVEPFWFCKEPRIAADHVVNISMCTCDSGSAGEKRVRPSCLISMLGWTCKMGLKLGLLNTLQNHDCAEVGFRSWVRL